MKLGALNLGAMTPIFNEQRFVPGCIQCVKPWVKRHVFLSAVTSLNGQVKKTDKTSEIAEDLGATVVEGDWREEHVQRNLGVAMLQDMDWIICLDADMWFTKDWMEHLIDELKTTKAKAICAPQWGYWHDTQHVLVGDDFTPVVAIRPDVRFTHIGCVNVPFQLFPRRIHHMAWCKPKDILKKVLTYGHAPELKDAEKWYNEVFLKWKPGKKAIMPDKANGEKGREFDVVFKTMPYELRRML